MTDTNEVLSGEVIESEDSIRKQRGKKPLKKYKIQFFETNGDKSDVEIIHNFNKKTFPRNKWCEIDENFMSVVRDAVHQSVRILRDDVTGDDIHEVINRPTLHYTSEAL